MSSPSDQIQDGDVFRYDRERYHCREGVAIAQIRDGKTYLVDTFWGTGTPDSHRLTKEEEGTAVFDFRPSEYRELDRYESYDEYHPRDRKSITSQHGLQAKRFLKVGAQPDIETQISNARSALEGAEYDLGRAQRTLETAQTVLAALLERKATS